MTSKFTYSYGFIIVLFNILDSSRLSSDANSFYSTSEDVQYIVENIPITLGKELSQGRDIELEDIIENPLYTSKAYLKFVPPVLDFKERFLGVPHHEKVTVINSSCNKTVHMSSISGNTVHFHSSFFQDKVIPPLGNTTFNVVFLGRGEGEIESTLFIHTSEGSFKYVVRGESILSPYRLRAFSGVRLPLNASYAPLILMHNPHSAPIQLVEVYSSGGDFHLELPSGDLEGPKHIWNIPAFLTKPIIRLRFNAFSQKNHTAYIRLKVDRSGEILVIPVDVEVGPMCGLYSSDDLIDFGIGGTHDPPKQVKLYLKNSWKKPIKVQNIISMPVSKALKIDFQPVKVLPDTQTGTEVAVLTFDWKAAHDYGYTGGRIIVKSAPNGHKLVLTYTASVLDGGLRFDPDVATYQSDLKEIEPRPITLINRYKVPVAIMNASLTEDAANFFHFSDFGTAIIEPGESKQLFALEVIGSSLPSDLKLDTEILVYSNVSTISIPLRCYDGKLSKIIPSDTNDTELNLGTVGSGNEKSINFALINENPISVRVTTLSIDIEDATVDIIGLERGNVSSANLAVTTYDSNTSLNVAFIEPGHFCVVRVTLPGISDPGSVRGEILIKTEFETISIPVSMRVEHGNLNVITNPVEFTDCFPSATCTAEVRVESNFSVGMAITGVASIPHQPRMGFIPVSPPLIPPQSNSLLGHITWDMPRIESYLSSNVSATAGQLWMETLTIPSHVREWDVSLLKSRFEQYQTMASELIELSLKLDTTEVRNLRFKAVIRPSWPSVMSVPCRNITFTLTQVGKVSYQQLTIVNPLSKESVVIQLVFDSHYPSSQGILGDLPSSLRPSLNSSSSYSSDDFSSPFQLIINGELKVPSVSDLYKKSVAFVLSPLTNASVTIAFKPEQPQSSSSILLIRNNLTIIEAVQLFGTGAYAQFKFGNRKHGSPLLFELVEKHLKDCEQANNFDGVPNLTVKRSFTARNTGALPLTVTGFSINGHNCQGYGFRVLNCQPFLLLANASKKIDIAFTPDFTLSRVTRMLTVFTSDFSANYTLLATLPPYLLSACSAALGRPIWEPVVYYFSVSFMVLLFVCVMAAAVFESNRILRNAIIALSKDQSIQPVLDLRAVGCEVNNEARTPEERPVESSQSKVNWASNLSIDAEGSKSSSLTEINFAKNFNTKYPLGNNSVISKRKTEKLACKRPSNESETTNEKSSWDAQAKASQGSSKSKTAAHVCFTTEPYTPLTTVKPKESLNRIEPFKYKYEQRVTTDGPPKNKKKKSEDLKKKSNDFLMASNAEESDFISVADSSSSNDDGDKEVESMFFKTVRNHLQNKVGKNRTLKFQNSLPGSGKSKKVAEKTSTSPADNEWGDMEEEAALDKATVVKSRRPNSAKLKKPCPSAGKLKAEQSQTKVKGNTIEKVNKPGSRRDKIQASKKRSSDKIERNNAAAKGGASFHKGLLVPPPPPPPVWTASFSDVVARDLSYSSALRNTHSTNEQKVQSSVAQTESGFNFTKGKQNEYPNEWSSDFSDGAPPNLSDGLQNQIPSPVGTNRMYGSMWNKWSALNESAHCQNSFQLCSSNSLFTHSPQQVSENIWNDQNASSRYNQHLSNVADQRDEENDAQNPFLGEEECYRSIPGSFDNNLRGDINWPAMPSLWEPLYTPSSTVETPPPVWGNNVWAPPTPPSPPPEKPIQHTLEYDPFRSLSNIWSQHSTNIWKPPTTE